MQWSLQLYLAYGCGIRYGYIYILLDLEQEEGRVQICGYITQRFRRLGLQIS